MYRKKHVIDTAVIHLIWLLAIMAASCSAITDDVPAQDDATLRLNIVSRDEGRLDTRAVTEAGNSHEFIHRLCVLIVAPDGTVVKKLLPNLDVVALAQQGNLRRWASDDFTITLGAYDVYAFANIDTYYDGLWGSLTGLAEGDNISGISPSLRSIVLADPASKIDLVDYFIPMSAYARVNVTKSTSAISIGLDRLVSKVRMTIRGKAGTIVTALSFAGYADRVGLFADTPLGDVKTMESNVVGVSPKTVQIGKKDSVSIADFYVNSSPAGRPYSVSVATNEHGGVVYKATTARTELPRNSIYPLILQLNDYGLDLEAGAGGGRLRRRRHLQHKHTRGCPVPFYRQGHLGRRHHGAGVAVRMELRRRCRQRCGLRRLCPRRGCGEGSGDCPGRPYHTAGRDFAVAAGQCRLQPWLHREGYHDRFVGSHLQERGARQSAQRGTAGRAEHRDAESV